jgi:pimeloyl-ACP methyl ester carboxylesterase
MNTRSTSATPLPLRPSDLRGLSKLGVDGSVGLTNLVEAVHHTITSRIGFDRALPVGRSSGITGAVYGAVRLGIRGTGRGVDAALRLVERTTRPHAPSSPERDAFVAALNGVCGDHLERSGNPLAIPMTMRSAGMALPLQRDALARALPAAGPKLLVLVHGLCMNDRQWLRRGLDHGQALAESLGFTPVYLHYNSGRHVSQNGREFAALLQQLQLAWPVPLEQLVIVGHSMGGLVARSACHYAEVNGLDWRRALRALVCLGTPHHGAALERGGRRIDQLLSLSPYVAPFARLGKARSAGITDLRFGNLQDADWHSRDRHAQHRDDRLPTPLPAGVATYLLAATTADKPGALHHELVGDGLVPLSSALGEHRDPKLALSVPAERRHVVTGCGHLDLLCNTQVQTQLQHWLATRAS